jgi:hypothetical protein
MMTAEVFVRRCQICGEAIHTPWGPNVHSESLVALWNHLQKHTDFEFRAFVYRQHYGLELR